MSDELTANAQRVQKHRKLKMAAGYKRISIWVKAENIPKIQRYVAKQNKAAEKAEATDAA